MIDLMIVGPLPRGLSRTDVLRALRTTFRKARRRETGAVSLAFVTDAEMRKLNRRWRGKRTSTDVLSFAPAASSLPKSAPKQWGDLIVSPTFVRRDADRRDITFREELLRVTIHGMLHLFGYDHVTRTDEKRMFGLQERVLREAI